MMRQICYKITHDPSHGRLRFSTWTRCTVVTRGSGHVNGKTVKDGDLVRGDNLNFKAAIDDVQVIIITTEKFES